MSQFNGTLQEVAIGEEVRYTLSLSVPEGITNAVVVRDTLPLGMEVTGGSVTNTDGVFTFEDVPVGLYSIVVQTGDSWAKYSGEFSLGSEFVPVLPGEQTDIGELIITLEEDE